jgi:hypothetical protein
MSVRKHTSFESDKSPSDKHYKMGSRLYMTDIDGLLYNYVDGEPDFVAIYDYKHGSAKKEGNKLGTMRVQSKLAERLDVPFFCILYYLDPELYDVPMYYVIPVNKKAKKIIFKLEPEKVYGFWLSEYLFSKWEHEVIRGLNFDDYKDEEEIQLLCQDCKKYPLPKLDF